MKYFQYKDLLLIVPISLVLGAVLASIQSGNLLIGFLGFSLLALIGFIVLTAATRWAGSSRVLVWMTVLAFILRFGGGVATYFALPVNGYNDPDDRAGYVYTDAHRRDIQAWELASSEHPIMDAFSRKFYTDQYGGLLGWSAFIYRYLSPDAHRPLMLVLVSALIAALGLPFLWKPAMQLWGEKVALASGWIFALYPESILLGGSAMREPYLMTFSAFALWGFVGWTRNHNRSAWLWLLFGLFGMTMVSPVVALTTMIILAGWSYFSSERGRVPWWLSMLAGLIFIAALFLLSWSLNRQGNLDSGTPMGVTGNFLREAVKWDVYQLERGSGWVQKLFDEMPSWLRLPFVVGYGLFQPVLPAALVEPTTLTWRIIAVLRAFGWYILLPILILSFLAALRNGRPAGKSLEEPKPDGSEKEQKLWSWLAIVCWAWILLAALRGGGDQWDNPRYRAILFLWQAILAGYVWIWWRERCDVWAVRVVVMEVVFLLFFGEWYANRYFHLGGQLAFGHMLAAILVVWGAILFGGWLWDRRRLTGKGGSL
jgi:hypothetical protein